MSNKVTEYDRPYSNLEIKDKDNPRSLVNICPTAVAQRIAAIPDEIFLLGEADLKIKAHVQHTDDLLRISFWEEYKRSERTNDKMNMNNVYAGFVTKAHFYHNVVTNSYKLAYICSPPPEIQVALEDIITLGMARQREILELPLVDAKGNINVKLALVMQKITEDGLNRRRGHVLRQTEVTTKNLNMNIEHKINTHKTVEEIEQEIAELENQKAPQLEYQPKADLIPAYKDVSNEKEKV